MGQLETSPASTVWRHVEVILPARLSVREALDRI
jgi:hypothetical protein